MSELARNVRLLIDHLKNSDEMYPTGLRGRDQRGWELVDIIKKQAKGVETELAGTALRFADWLELPYPNGGKVGLAPKEDGYDSGWVTVAKIERLLLEEEEGRAADTELIKVTKERDEALLARDKALFARDNAQAIIEEKEKQRKYNLDKWEQAREKADSLNSQLLVTTNKLSAMKVQLNQETDRTRSLRDKLTAAEHKPEAGNQAAHDLEVARLRHEIAAKPSEKTAPEAWPQCLGACLLFVLIALLMPWLRAWVEIDSSHELRKAAQFSTWVGFCVSMLAAAVSAICALCHYAGPSTPFPEEVSDEDYDYNRRIEA